MAKGGLASAGCHLGSPASAESPSFLSTEHEEGWIWWQCCWGCLWGHRCPGPGWPGLCGGLQGLVLVRGKVILGSSWAGMCPGGGLSEAQ